MLFKVWLNYLIGFLTISVEGYYKERFINLCKVNNILLWNVKRKDDLSFESNISILDFKKIKKILRKTNCKVKILERKGIPFFINRYRKRKLFFLLFILMFGSLLISSNFVWNIDVKIENGEGLENIYSDLSNAGLEIGQLKRNIDTNKIINEIRYKRDDISWMGIDLKGTNVIVKIVKAISKPEIVDENQICDIVSDKEGIITKINVQDGTALVKVGDVVKKGTILIGGWIEGKYTDKRYVHARGEIEGKVWHDKEINIPLEATEESKTGEYENKYSIKINNFKINFYKKLSNFEFYDTIDAERKIQLFSDFYLPISIIKTTNEQKKTEQKNYTVDEARDLGIKQLEAEFDKEIEDKSKITNKIVTTNENENSVDIRLTYEITEDIGTNEKR